VFSFNPKSYLHARVCKDFKEVLIFSIDGLTGLKEAIQAVYPKVYNGFQSCIKYLQKNMHLKN